MARLAIELNDTSLSDASVLPMRLRVSSCGCLYFNTGSFEWDDYIDHQRTGLDETAEAVLAQFREWTEHPARPRGVDKKEKLQDSTIDSLILSDLNLLYPTKREM